MDSNEQKKVFIKIALGAFKNIIGFGLATAFIGYMATHSGIDIPLMIIAAVVTFIMVVSIVTLLLFIVYTIKGIPVTLKNSPKHIKFFDLYAYTFLALSFRLIEAAICIGYIVYLYKLFI
ncbi:MAG: hypothetical protein PHF24_01335 [Syntrophomonas sp.]|nr:hypothetical protein [Syntrophomonas sp.]